ncbi:hypothetical protein BKA83DRAFT_4224507 [Pisolithus microcarpus]|nr:hypothetical protein BKA83DRAFT_4224507 [Pisolithus microcarpus]
MMAVPVQHALYTMFASLSVPFPSYGKFPPPPHLLLNDVRIYLGKFPCRNILLILGLRLWSGLPVLCEEPQCQGNKMNSPWIVKG